MDTRPLVDRLRLHAWRLRDSARDRVVGPGHRREVFQRIYDQNLWGDSESASGVGSGTFATETIRRELPALFARYRIRSLLDAPCGDFHWMQHMVQYLDHYVGVDIVPQLVERNSMRYGTSRVSFLCADVASDPLPTADTVICRDCFIHLPTRLIRTALANFRASGARYLLLTNNLDAGRYHDVPIGSFRPVNFLRPPFSFPTPVDAISEDGDNDRQLCLWTLDALDI
jgi:hypothetical protein